MLEASSSKAVTSRAPSDLTMSRVCFFIGLFFFVMPLRRFLAIRAARRVQHTLHHGESVGSQACGGQPSGVRCSFASFGRFCRETCGIALGLIHTAKDDRCAKSPR
ncbi:hypothetical protein GGTG_08842 [Gaeumannomyces tritici R3-111a-1]|uniref:Uncharacterized protein n=1 Tax=Gaeumannomyces tritici (strain R3-111a-1) TaxID=644352 RepID=J3P5Q2_GAET3|nr:hypothetical protein GGTG_08842 [Gaeumannomyces tritici R3-111a-1]EJT75004.1 hypothetical protein GGTG_08842 [Gaeumannomyces tritici R3-111a-1]